MGGMGTLPVGPRFRGMLRGLDKGSARVWGFSTQGGTTPTGRPGQDNPIQLGSFTEGLAEASGNRAIVGEKELSLQPLRVRLGLRIPLAEDRLAGETYTEFIIICSWEPSRESEAPKSGWAQVLIYQIGRRVLIVKKYHQHRGS